MENKEVLGCSIQLLVAVLVIGMLIYVPRTDYWAFRKVRRSNESYSCLAYLDKRPDGKYVDQALGMYLQRIGFPDCQDCDVDYTRRFARFNQDRVRRLAEEFPSSCYASDLRALSDSIIVYYLTNIEDTEEFWTEFKRRVDDQYRLYADENINRLKENWNTESGAFFELRKYITSNVERITQAERNLIKERYEQYLKLYPDGDNSPEVWRSYALFLKSFVDYMQDNYVNIEDIDDYIN